MQVLHKQSNTVHTVLAKPSNGGSAHLGVAAQHFHYSKKKMISHGGVSEAEEESQSIQELYLDPLDSHFTIISII